MPERTDIRKILVIGSGPIQIGQGCEFDYSGTQACLALRELGYQVCLVNSNPATIMTDPETAERVYIEPLTLDSLVAVIESEKPDAILPTVGGQVGLNLFLELHQEGVLAKYDMQVLGVSAETVMLTEDRHAFRNLLKELGLSVVGGGVALSEKQARSFASELNFPMVLRASFTLGGSGGGLVWNQAELDELIALAFSADSAGVLAIEESLLGWKEYELEVMRDRQGTFVVVCGVENINPMGVHTGDSITCAPCMTLSDREFQNLRNIAKSIFERVGMETGGANIQFAVHPDTGRVVVIEMNPRVSRSSALVSKATGYPIARIAAKLSAGLTLAELKNEMTGTTSAAFEPMIDYVAVKIPRWNFEKFPDAKTTLGIQMKSVGEVLAFGRTFRDAFQKAWRSLELGFEGWPELAPECNPEEHLTSPTPFLFQAIKSAMKNGLSIEQLYDRTKISRWFLTQMQMLLELEDRLGSETLSEDLLRCAKQDGFTNAEVARLSGVSLAEVRKKMQRFGIRPTFKCVDSCAGEFESSTQYFYKTYDTFDESSPSEKRKVVVLGSGPNRIGQGVEFDYSCVHALQAIQSAGFEAILINCNPETVSTDWSVSDRLYIEPLHEEDVLDILGSERPEGVFVQFGGQSPLKLTDSLVQAGYQIFGTSSEIIALAEDREQFAAFARLNGVRVPAWSIGRSLSECLLAAEKIGFPLLVRPSFVLGGRAMQIVKTLPELEGAVTKAIEVAQGHPVLLDRYLDAATEYDVDLVCDGSTVFIPAIMEHIEEAGIHSGDSVSVIPPLKTPLAEQEEIRKICSTIATQLGVRGLLNIQLAKCAGEFFVLEVNPRSSRSVPFVSKATGVPLARWGALVALGQPLDNLVASFLAEKSRYFAVKFPVFPFAKFIDSVPTLGPEMRSIGEVMGIAESFGSAVAKAFAAAGSELKGTGRLVLVTDRELASTTIELFRVLINERNLKLAVVLDKNLECVECLNSLGCEVVSPEEYFGWQQLPHRRNAEGVIERLQESLACSIVLCDPDRPRFKPIICDLHKRSLSERAPLILSEQLFEAWGRALFATGTMSKVSCLSQ